MNVTLARNFDEVIRAVAVSPRDALARWALAVFACGLLQGTLFRHDCATIAPRFVALEAGRCEVRMSDRRRVHNHIGTVHAIALCNLAELSAGVMSEATVPAGMRWIPRSMSVSYLKKAVGTMHAVATPDRAAIESASAYEWPVSVQVADAAGDTVFEAHITMWLSPRKSG